MAGKLFPFTQFRSLRRARLLVAVMLPALLVGVTPAGAAGPADNQVPSITDIQLAVPEVGPGDQVSGVVNGRFAPSPLGSAPVVSVNGDPTISFAVLAWDDNQIFGTLSIGATTPLGLKTLKVEQKVAGQDSEATKAAAFRVGFTPVITGVSPATMSADNGAVVTINGAKFEPAATVTLTGPTGELVNPTSTSVSANGQTITASFEADAELKLGTWTLTVANPGAGTSATFTTFQITGAAPSVATVSVSQIGVGVSDVPVVVTGNAFYKGVSVAFSGSDLTIGALTRVTSTQLQFTLSASDSAAPGSRAMTITNGDGQSETVPGAIEVIEKPVVTDGQVVTLPQGIRSASVIVKGTGFLSSTTVSFVNRDGTALAPGEELWFTTTSQALTTGGIRIGVNVDEMVPVDRLFAVRFENPGGGNDTCKVTSGQLGCLSVTQGPKVTNVNPTVLTPGWADRLTIDGQFFQIASQWGFGAPQVVISGLPGIELDGPVQGTPTSLSVPVFVDPDADEGCRTVTVINGDRGRTTWDGCLDVVASGP